RRVPRGPKISTRSMRRAFVERTICAESWRKPRQLSTMLCRRRFRERNHERPTPRQPPDLQPSTHGNRGVRFPGRACLDMRWSWNHATDGVWRTLDPLLWELTQNPWVVLQTVARDQIERVLADPVFRKNVDDLLRDKRQAAETPAWFQQKHPQAPLTCVAYFSMEFMLSEALPIYSGGLG